MGKLSMTRSEREEFLAGFHVGVISIAEEGRGPLSIPIWYDYVPGGEVRIVTGADSRKLVLLRRTGRFTLCAQDENPPYRYVTVEGPVVGIEPASVEDDERPLAHRYLGPELGDAYVAATTVEAGPSNVLVRMRPERWATVDYRKEYGGA
jgi:nitroimidazol reductase NimA-like FMN-containing flavoprotein (pyridoxamine 5'-phosphate oxidase superfamily)